MRKHVFLSVQSKTYFPSKTKGLKKILVFAKSKNFKAQKMVCLRLHSCALNNIAGCPKNLQNVLIFLQCISSILCRTNYFPFKWICTELQTLMIKRNFSFRFYQLIGFKLSVFRKWVAFSFKLSAFGFFSSFHFKRGRAIKYSAHPYLKMLVFLSCTKIFQIR